MITAAVVGVLPAEHQRCDQQRDAERECYEIHVGQAAPPRHAGVIDRMPLLCVRLLAFASAIRDAAAAAA
jgi:hypothetical protein